MQKSDNTLTIMMVKFITEIYLNYKSLDDNITDE